jgi:N-acetylglucosamine repressor
MRIPDPETTLNQQLDILRLLRTHGALTRRQLAEQMGCSVSLVRQLTEALVDHALIVPHGSHAAELRGRPSQLWSLAPDACIALGLDVSSHTTQVVALNAGGDLLLRRAMPTPHSDTPEAFLSALAAFVAAALRELGAQSEAVRGLGVAYGGFVDFKRGLSLDAIHIAHSFELPLQRRLSTLTGGLPVIVDDRARAMALAEARYGAARDHSDCICVSVSVGVGTGIILDGQLFRGPLGLAGELGHIPVLHGGRPCRCGGRGCLETLVSSAVIEAHGRDLIVQGVPTLLRDLCEGVPAQLTIEMIKRAAEADDAPARALLEYASQWLGAAVATLVNLFSVEMVVLTGSVMRGSPMLLDMVRQQARPQLIPHLRDRVQIVLTELADSAPALGAATFVIDAEFEQGLVERLRETVQR